MPSILPGILTTFLLAHSTLAEFKGRDHTYWVDTVSCGTKLGGAVDEAFATAKLIAKRLPDSNSQALQSSPLANAFKALFSREEPDFWYLTDAATQDLGTLFGGGAHSLSKFSSNQDNQLEAEIRIYCDNDERWEERRNDPRQREGTPNKDRPKDTLREYIDPINNIVIQQPPACWVPGADMALYGRLGPNIESDSQHPNRVTITVCNQFLNMPKRINTFRDDIPKKKTFTKGAVETITFLNQITSMKLFHEFMHHSRYRKDDIPDPSQSNDAYGWAKCVEKSEADARGNADNWALLGTAAQCMQRKFWVDPENPKSGKLLLNDQLEAVSVEETILSIRATDGLNNFLPSFSQMKREVVPAKEPIL